MIDLINTTKNHHFISQVEQRWNASSNPDNPSLARICKYEIVDKSSFEVHATNRPLIKNTSAKDDLYTLELFEWQKRTCSFYSPPALCYLCARYERNELTV